MMRTGGLVVALCFAAGLSPAAQAHHVVWLDFSAYHLDAFVTVNGNYPPEGTDLTAIQSLVIENMVKDWAAFDVYFTQDQPAYGRYTRVRFLGTKGGTAFGCSGMESACCSPGGLCTGIGTWDTMTVSGCEVHVWRFADFPEFTGRNATW
jgi:hypothetical protein